MLYDGDIFEHNGNRFKVTFPPDWDRWAPWDEEDGHGPVSDWTTRAKRPGELILARDGCRYQYYDFAEACRIARRDGWGPGFYHQREERGANGLRRGYAQWYVGRQLHTYTGEWRDDEYLWDGAREAMRASYPSARAYAAAAAMADYDRLRQWCDDQWCYVGVVVELVDEEDEPVSCHGASLWGIESDAGDYLEEVARELADEVIADFRAVVS